MDLTIHPGTLKPHKSLKNDGTIVTEVIKSVRVPNTGNPKRAKSFQEGSKFLTVKSFLGTRAIRAKHSMDDIDYCSNNNSTPCHLQRITVPILILGMGGHYFLRDNEVHYEVSASPDKEYVVIEGASHGSGPVKLARLFPINIPIPLKTLSITFRNGSMRASESPMTTKPSRTGTVSRSFARSKLEFKSLRSSIVAAENQSKQTVEKLSVCHLTKLRANGMSLEISSKYPFILSLVEV
jgi:hypothetical protein